MREEGAIIADEFINHIRALPSFSTPRHVAMSTMLFKVLFETPSAIPSSLDATMIDEMDEIVFVP